MSTKTELMQAQEVMVALLDTKLGNMPEWKAFRAIQRAISAEEEAPNPPPKTRTRTPQPGQALPYTVLTGSAIKERGRPIPTPTLIEFIGQHRDLGPDLERAKVNITSTLSKSPLFKSVPWEGGKGWWYANQPVPK
jgi:hypothetical protein